MFSFHWLKWAVSVVVSPYHLEDTIKSFLKNRSDLLVNANPGVVFVNDGNLATKILKCEEFNQKGYLDESFGLYSFRPFLLQQLVNDDTHQRLFCTTKAAFAEGRIFEVVPTSQTISEDFIKQFQTSNETRTDLLILFRKVALQIAIRMTFGVDLDEDDFQCIFKCIRNIDEYVKRVSLMDLNARVKCWKTICKLWLKVLQTYTEQQNAGHHYEATTQQCEYSRIPEAQQYDCSKTRETCADTKCSNKDHSNDMRNFFLSSIGKPCKERSTSFIEILCKLKFTNQLQLSNHEIVDHILSGFLTYK